MRRVTMAAVAVSFAAAVFIITGSLGPAATDSAQAVAPTAGGGGLASASPATRAPRNDGEDAVAAAAAYVTAGEALLAMDPLSAEEALRRMAATARADVQVDSARNRLSSLRSSLAGGSGPIVYRQAAIAWRLESIEDSRARVAVWHVGVLAREGVAPPQAAWSVSTVELVREHDGWKVDAHTVRPGPAPILDNSATPATAGQLVLTLDGFTSFGYRP